MPPYTISKEDSSQKRILTVMANSSLRYRFYHKNGKEQVKFSRAGSRIIAITEEDVMVYKKPHAMQYHKELMLANSRAMWLGLQSDPDRLIDNMLEYVETI